MARPRTGGNRKPQAVYATDEQVEYLRWWLKHKGDVPPKPWKLPKKADGKE